MANEYRIPPELQARLDKLEEDKARLEKALSDTQLQNRAPVGEEFEPGKFRHVIDLPASGGTAIVINGVQYFHGQAYEFDAGQMASVLDIEHRSWAHEREVKGNGSFENAYRRPVNTVLSMRGAR